MDDEELAANQREIDRLKSEIQASPIVARRTVGQKARKWIAEAALIVGIVSFLYAGVAQHSATVASQRARAACQLYKTVAEAPVAPKTTPLGLKLAASSRVAYYSAHCGMGTLSPPDPRVVPLLPLGLQ